MAYYLSKYVGTYRVIADIDLSTNDFPRSPDTDAIEQTDVYIKCKGGARVYHYGRNKLVGYIPSLGRGRNKLKSIAIRFGLLTQDQISKMSIEDIYKVIKQDGRVFAIFEGDEEVEWKFDDRNKEAFEIIMDEMCPMTSGASISPYSTRNLPIDKTYQLSDDELKAYGDLVDSIPKEDKLKIHRTTTDFLSTVVQKKYKEMNLTKERKKKMLKEREFIHSLGMYNEYLKYLKNNL